MEDLEMVINGMEEIGLNQEQNVCQFLENPILKNLIQVWYFF